MREKIVYFCGFCGHESDHPEDSCTKCGVKYPLKMWRKLIDEEPPSKEAAA
tara:strand:+ start:357 stop:509 length:153 start_codon:yes stop_codon:yes gene_type:complete